MSATSRVWDPALASPPSARDPRPLALVGATVLTMRGRERLADHTLVIEDGVVVRLGPRTDVELDGVETVDGRGRFVVPGLTDAHAHLTEPRQAAWHLSAGVTSIRCLSGAPALLEQRARVEAGRLPGPRMDVAAPIIDAAGGGEGSIVFVGLTDPLGAEPLVRAYAEAGYDFIKGYSGLSPEVHRALGRACDAEGLHFGGHCPRALTIEEAIASGQRSFEHLFGIAKGRLDGPEAEERYATLESPFFPELSREGLTLIDRHLDRTRLRELAAFLAAEEVWSCPTLCLATSVLFGPAEAPPGALALTDFARAPEIRPEYAERTADGDRVRDLLLELVATLADAGAPIVAGTDTPCAWTVPGYALLDELDLFVEAGMSPTDALATSVVGPHRLLGRADPFGTVQVGAPADLVLLDGDPSRTLAPLRDPALVLVNGWRLDRAALAGWRARS